MLLVLLMLLMLMILPLITKTYCFQRDPPPPGLRLLIPEVSDNLACPKPRELKEKLRTSSLELQLLVEGGVPSDNPTTEVVLLSGSGSAEVVPPPPVGCVFQLRDC